MATSHVEMQTSHVKPSEVQSFHDKLNAQWHKRALWVLMIVVLGHWAEHLVQATQIYILGWPRPRAGGILGLWYPWLVTTEALHYGYALVMLIGIWVLRKGFTGKSHQWWTVALVIQFWHHIEHALLIGQATFHHNLFGSPVPMSILQLFIPRVELHLFYNTIVFIPMMVAMYYHVFPSESDKKLARCTCAWQNSAISATSI